MLKRLLREPLVHFLILGGLVFLLFNAAARPDAPQDVRIVVTGGRIEQLATAYVRTWQRAPSTEELDGLIEDYIRDEVLYREALAMGLDKDDSVIRRRMRQKFEFLAEDEAAAAHPTDQDLQAWLDKHPDNFRLPPKLALRQVYVSVSRRGQGAAREALRLLAQLNGARKKFDASELGDPTMLPYELPPSSGEEIARLFGDGFAREVARMEPGRWSGPVKSGYGLHLVYVSERAEGGPRPLAEVRDAVQRDWLAARHREAADASYRALREKYAILIGPPAAERSGDSINPVGTARAARGK